jgi:hypothetical protein
MMKVLEYITKAIGAIWKFATSVTLIGVLAGIAFFVLSTLMPGEVQEAIEIIKSLLSAG